MDLNYVCTELNLRAQIDARLRDAGYIQSGSSSPLVNAIGWAAGIAARLAGRLARWAEGSSEFRGGRPRAAIH